MQNRFQFDVFSLDVHNACLRRGEAEIHLTPKAFSLLSHLLENHGQLVTKEQLLEAVWPESIISDSTLGSTIRELRQALKDDAKAPRYIETVHRRGYRFIGEVGSTHLDMAIAKPASKKPLKRKGFYRAITVVILLGVGIVAGFAYRYLLSSQPKPVNAANVVYTLPDKPSLVVLPFANFSADSSQAFLVDGITESIISTLAKVPDIFVIAEHSAFAYKNKPTTTKQAAEALGVRYVLDGSVQTDADNVRVVVQLIDALTGGYLWTEDFDRPLGNIFEIQDDISQQVMTELQVKLTRGEQARIWRRNTDNFDAYVAMLQGSELTEQITKLKFIEGQQYFKHAIALDPNYATAWAKLGYIHLLQIRYEWVDDPESSRQLVNEIAEKAIKLDETDVYGLLLLQELYKDRRNFKQVQLFAEKAVAYHPNDALSLINLAGFRTYSGQLEKALILIEQALRLSPFYPTWYLIIAADVHFFLGHYDQAIALYEQGRDGSPNSYRAYVRLAYAYGAAGRLEEAHATVKKLLTLEPSYTIQSYIKERGHWFQKPEMLEQVLEGFRKAGLPE